VTINGKDIYLGKYESIRSRAEYDRLVAEWLVNGRAAGKSDDLSINEMLLAFVEWAETYYVKDGRPTSQVLTIKHAVRPVRELYGDQSPRSFTVQSLRTVRQQFVDAGLARSEVNRRTRIVIQAFRHGVVEGLVPADVVVALKMLPALLKGRTPAPERPPVEPVDDAMVDAVLPHLSAPVRAMVLLQRHTGMRPGEIVVMRTGDLVPDESLPGIWFIPEHHKSEHRGRERKIYFGPRARAVLEPWLRPDEPDGFLFSPRASLIDLATRRRTGRHINRKRRPTKTRRRVGERFSVDSYRRAIAIGCDKAFPHAALSKIPDRELTEGQRAELGEWRQAHRFHPHQIRHSVSSYIEDKLDIKTSQTVLGHANVKETLGYTKENFRKAAMAMEEFG
jgi:integrase